HRLVATHASGPASARTRGPRWVTRATEVGTRSLTGSAPACEPRKATRAREGVSMVDQRYPARRSRSLLGPVAVGLVLIAALGAVIALRGPLWEFAKVAGRTVSDWLTNWAPAHPRQTAAVVGFALLTLVINWVAHVRGRLRAWIFALVVEIGLWLLFWYGPGI